MDILNWLSQFLAAQRSGLTTFHPLRILHGKYEPGCIQLQGQLDGKSAAPLSNVAIRVQWIKGSMEQYYDLVADVASQLAWIVATLL
jgi:hypothetical protein